MSRWLPLLLGLGALCLPKLQTLDPLPHALLVGLYLLYCAVVTLFVILPGLPEFNTALPDEAIGEKNRSVVPAPRGPAARRR